MTIALGIGGEGRCGFMRIPMDGGSDFPKPLNWGKGFKRGSGFLKIGIGGKSDSLKPGIGGRNGFLKSGRGGRIGFLKPWIGGRNGF